MSDAATESRNEVTISDIGPSRKKLTIEIPVETVKAKLNESLDTLAVEATLPGFRKGHVPRRLVEKRFGTAVHKEAKNQMVAEAYSQAVEEHKLQVISEPTADAMDEITIDADKPLVIELEVEVLPEFVLPELNGIKVFKPTLEVTDEDIEKELERICLTEGTLEEQDDCKPGDYLSGTARMELPDGTEFYNINGAVVQVPPEEKEGRGMILGIMVDDFGTQLGSPKVGDEISIKAKGPKNHEIERLRDTDLAMTFTVDRIDRIVPADPETLSIGFGFASLDALKAEIRSRLEDRMNNEQQTLMRQQVANTLIESTEIALPEKMTEQQTERNLERKRYELMYRGIDAQHIEEQLSDLRNASHDVARRELNLYFILHRAAEDLAIKVSEADVNARIVQLATQRQERPEKLRQELIQKNQINNIFQQVREHKALDAILAKADVEEISKEDFEKKFNDENDAKKKK